MINTNIAGGQNQQAQRAQRAEALLQDRRRRFLLAARASLLEVHYFEKAGR